ncbi:MAG: SRPBCC domain-containing protein [Gammaproteobacteria bacterium]|nr:SRPBCC domain-containing protein [Gammaproteobacteria bacterium]
MSPRVLALALAAVVATPLAAEVTVVDERGFVSEHELHIAAPPDRAFTALVDEIGAWWDPAHTYWGDSSRLTFECGFDLALCEDSEDGEGFARHMTVDSVRPGESLVLSGGLGPLQPLGVAASMSFRLRAAEQGTRLDYRYIVNGRDLEQLAEPVDRVQGEQLARLKRYVETGNPEPASD